MTDRAISLDLDGVVIFRPPIQAGALFNRHIIRRGRRMYNPPDAVPQITRESPLEGQMKPSELVSFLTHCLKWVYPGAKYFIRDQREAHFYGNTGRRNKTPWIQLTRKTLERGGVLERFEDIYFRPEGTRTMLSKLEAIDRLRTRYTQVTHYDDNPADALPIAAFFPDVKVVIVQDLSTGLLYSREEAAKYPNVMRVARLKDYK